MLDKIRDGLVRRRRRRGINDFGTAKTAGSENYARFSSLARAILLYRSIKLFDSLTTPTGRSELSPLRSVSADAVGLGTFLDVSRDARLVY